MTEPTLQLREESKAFLKRYASISAAFEVRECLHAALVDNGVGGITFQPSAIALPYVKDYDALSVQKPSEWELRFGLEKWWFGAALMEGRAIGAIAVALDTTDLEGVRSREDEAIIWDIRVVPEHRHQGVGRTLMLFAEDHIRAAGKRSIKVETQNINAAACRLYAAVGYTLQSIDLRAYPELPNEAQLIWGKELR